MPLKPLPINRLLILVALAPILTVAFQAQAASRLPIARAAAASPASSEPRAGSHAVDADLLTRWAENEALVEWQVGRIAAACNEVATAGVSPAVRRDALRLKAAYGASSYAILSGGIPLVQALDLTAMAALSHRVWIVEGRAAREFGGQARPVEQAFNDIQGRIRAHVLAYLSADELAGVEKMVGLWREEHPGPVVVEFIRFEAFADEVASLRDRPPELGGLFGRLKSRLQSMEMLGERALSLASRMPRLTEWHAEAAAANILAQPEIGESMVVVRQFGELQRTLPAQVALLESRVASLPAELAGALTREPGFRAALAELGGAAERMKALEGSLRALEKSVGVLGGELARIGESTHPAAVRQLADQAGARAGEEGRSLVLLASACAAGLLLLNAALRRWTGRPARDPGSPKG